MSDSVTVAVILCVPPTLAAIASFVASRANARKIQQIHIDMNSRFEEWMKATKAASFAEGAKSERDKIR